MESKGYWDHLFLIFNFISQDKSKPYKGIPDIYQLMNIIKWHAFWFYIRCDLLLAALLLLCQLCQSTYFVCILFCFLCHCVSSASLLFLFGFFSFFPLFSLLCITPFLYFEGHVLWSCWWRDKNLVTRGWSEYRSLFVGYWQWEVPCLADRSHSLPFRADLHQPGPDCRRCVSYMRYSK